ncbi:MAG: hypothetical protein SVS85_01495 [Candidatus Nanohaloarchaea archaeon]|nr:hypothetical protein [Candidatus Nanohaloarchaea archaeon]
MDLKLGTVLMLSMAVTLAGCTTPQKDDIGGKMMPAAQITEVNFQKTPELREGTKLRFTVKALRDINNSRVEINTSGRAVNPHPVLWKDMEKGELYLFSRELIFPRYGFYTVKITAGEYGTAGYISADIERIYVNMTRQGTEVLNQLSRAEDSVTGPTHPGTGENLSDYRKRRLE